ncbi:MAG: HNH endonuclease family protein [Endozoicomonas sp.]
MQLTYRSILIPLLSLCLSVSVSAELVKQSKSGTCHDTGSPYYSRTKNFTPFPSLSECLSAGGRLPKGHTGSKAVSKSRDSNSHHKTGYDREQFDHWIDANGDCINTRHELLMKQSTSTVDTGKNKCTAERGRWLDPYTGKTFHNARDLDIDHLIPLKWAWEHGADQWPSSKRRTFANDESNLFAVKASVNRAKGAKGPLQWLPPDSSFHCQYIARFKRIALKYHLVWSEHEKVSLDRLYQQKCKR